jgi:hypothetical protein
MRSLAGVNASVIPHATQIAIHRLCAANIRSLESAAMGEDLASEALQRVDQLEAALRRLTFSGMVGPQVHNLAEKFAPMFYGVRYQVEAWERSRQGRTESSGA